MARNNTHHATHANLYGADLGLSIVLLVGCLCCVAIFFWKKQWESYSSMTIMLFTFVDFGLRSTSMFLIWYKPAQWFRHNQRIMMVLRAVPDFCYYLVLATLLYQWFKIYTFLKNPLDNLAQNRNVKSRSRTLKIFQVLFLVFMVILISLDWVQMSWKGGFWSETAWMIIDITQ